MGPEFGGINAVEQTVNHRILAIFEKILNGVRVVVVSEIIEVLQVGIVRKRGAGITASDFVTTYMVQCFLRGAVLVDGPGEELVELVAGQPCSGQQIGSDAARFGEHFCLIGRWNRSGRLIAPIEGSVRDGVVLPIRVGLLVPLKMIPTGEDNSACAVENR